MEKDRGSRLIAIIALVIAVVGLSIGFAAFTKDLNITFGESNVNISGELDIKFLASNDPNDTSTTINGVPHAVSENANISANPATISTDDATISGLGATFSDKDQFVYYDLYIYNNSEYDTYLKSVDFLNYTGAEISKVCTALEGTTQSLVDAACEDIHMVIYFDTDGSGYVDDSVEDVYVFDTRSNDFTSIKISKGEMIAIGIDIMYAGDVVNEGLFGTTGSALLPNGDFKINFGDIKFNFSSLEG